MAERQIVALGGGGFSVEPDNSALDDFVLGLTGRSRPKICFLPTGTGNVATYIVNFYEAFRGRAEASHLDLFTRTGPAVRPFLLDQDAIYVGGGSIANLLAIWRAHGLDTILGEAWRKGIVLAGLSAGAICWFNSGVTDSLGPELGPMTGALGLLPGSFCPHYDGEPGRRPAYHRLVADGALAGGWAADDGAAIHFVGTEVREVVASRPGAAAYRIDRRRGRAAERRLEARLLV